MKALKFIISLSLIFFIIIHQVECHTINKAISQQTKDDKISFIESDSENDESEKIKAKIRKEMDEYQKKKEDKKKSNTTKVISTTTSTSTTTTTQAPSSSTLVHVYLIGIDEPADFDQTTLSENTVESTTSDDFEVTTIVDDRFILDAPNICRDGQKYVNGRCRIIY